MAIYVKKSFDVLRVDHQMNSLDLLSIEIKPKKARSFFLVSWYQPPTSNVDDGTFENLRAVLMRLDRQDKEIIFIGDTNCDLMDNRNANTKKLKQEYS